MTRTILKAVAVASLITCGSANLAEAQVSRAPASSTHPWQTAGYFSWRLGARFEMQQMSIPGYPYAFLAARIVSQPVPGSPLHQLGLGVGDVITRLDGTRVLGYTELDRHHLTTYVRYIKQGSGFPQNGTMWVPRFQVHSQYSYGYPSSIAPAPIQTP